jgi:hypothetical protein
MTGLSRLDASDSIQRPLSFVTHRGIVCGCSQRLTGRLCLRPEASQRTGRADAHIEEFILQSFDQLRHSGLRGRADACEGFTRRPSDAGNRIAQGSGEVLGRRARLRTDGGQGLRRVDADVWFLVRESLDESAYRRTGPLPKAPRARAASPRPSNPRLSVPVSTPAESDSVSGARSIKASGAAPEGDLLMPKQSTSSGMAGGPIRRMISKVCRCRSSLRRLRNRLSKGSERPAPWTRAASAVAGPSDRWP